MINKKPWKKELEEAHLKVGGYDGIEEAGEIFVSHKFIRCILTTQEFCHFKFHQRVFCVCGQIFRTDFFYQYETVE